jgi:2-oxoglutarate dehydrogenase E1 component
MDTLSFLQSIHPEELEALYKQYQTDSKSVAADWQLFFKGFDLAVNQYPILPLKKEGVSLGKEFSVLELIAAYRQRGHYFTKTNPVRKRRVYKPDLSLSNFGLAESDLQTVFSASHEVGLHEATLAQIIELLEQTYCHSVGVEYMYIRLPDIVEWLQTKMEQVRNILVFSNSQKENIHTKLAHAVYFEQFIHKRFPGQKRFSLEGAESVIPALHFMIDYASTFDVQSVVFGMPHRGRLNILSNIFHKPLQDIFSEFAGKEYDDAGLLGDVKYHQGHQTRVSLGEDKEVELILSVNPSHLEAVGPVIQGLCRAKIDNEFHGNLNKVIPVIIHGDASIAGQGVVYEEIQMSELSGYKTGGTIHIVINNQIGFTTNYLDARSSIYCTDVAKVIQSPIFHVNGDDVEAMVYVFQLAVDYRLKFNKDVFIDVLCYRKYGHNESDEPRYTQPELYKIIEKHPNPLQIYSEKLLAENILTNEGIKHQEEQIVKQFDDCLNESQKRNKISIKQFLYPIWENITKATEEDYLISYETAVNIDILLEVGRKANTLPQGIQVYNKILKLLHSRRVMLDEDRIDWALAEQLAYGTLLNEGVQIRISGQDVERGTFSHRHAVLLVEDTFEKYIPLNHIRKGQATFEIYNSLLSEYAVLGFEYGYALNSPNNLVIWEAQFGDFMNGAQIIIDQFISSAEEKWNAFNNLILFLPHGYEGQGPEHSSARIERFLNLSANLNMDVLQCSTPANFFHAIRRHMKRPFRKPMILFTPKSLLRHKDCVSKLEDFSEMNFQEVIDDTNSDTSSITKIVLCSGKIYYDLIDERARLDIKDTAIVRLEQLYPFPKNILNTVLQRYMNGNEFFWIQEEPVNMGAWKYVSQWLKQFDFKVIARPVSSSPATGSYEFHKLRHAKLIEKAFGECKCERSKIECKMICLSAENNIELL